MFLLEVGLINSGSQRGTKISVPDVADNADDGDVEVLLITRAFHQMAAHGILGRTEETLCEGEIDDGNVWLALGISGREFASHEKRLMDGGEVAGRDARLLEIHPLIFCRLVSLHRVV